MLSKIKNVLGIGVETPSKAQKLTKGLAVVGAIAAATEAIVAFGVINDGVGGVIHSVLDVSLKLFS